MYRTWRVSRFVESPFVAIAQEHGGGGGPSELMTPVNKHRATHDTEIGNSRTHIVCLGCLVEVPYLAASLVDFASSRPSRNLILARPSVRAEIRT